MDNEIVLANIATPLTQKDSHFIIKQLNIALSAPNSLFEFPGSHPVTLLKKHINLLITKDYLVCEKSDGIRAFLYTFNHKGKIISLFVDRTNTMYHSEIKMSVSKDTVLDGELYYDQMNGKKHLIFSVFDCLIADGVLCLENNLVSRLEYARKMVSLIKWNHKINVKQMYKSYGFCEVYRDIPKMKHKNDGMIFTPVNEPYKLGRCDTLLKWKPSHLNTVDFLLKRVDDCQYVYALCCYCKGNVIDVFDYFFDLEEAFPGSLDNLIGEFYFDSEKDTFDYESFYNTKGGWVLHRLRTDKKTPNSCKVIVNVISSIKENIDYMDLEKHFLDMRNGWKRREIIRTNHEKK